MLAIILSFGYVDALIPLLIIIILIAAAAGLTRGWDALKIFGIEAMTGIGASAAGKGSLAKKSAYRYGRTTMFTPGQYKKLRTTLSPYIGAEKGRQLRAKIGTNRAEKSVRNALAEGMGVKRTYALGPVGRFANRVNLATKFTPKLRMAMGTAMMASGITAAAGYRQTRLGAYNKAQMEWEQANKKFAKVKTEEEKNKAQAEKEKWAAKMHDLRAKHGFVPSSRADFLSAQDQQLYWLKKMKDKADEQGNILKQAQYDKLTEKLTISEKLRQLYYKQYYQQSRGGTGRDAAKMAKEFNTKDKLLSKKSVFREKNIENEVNTTIRANFNIVRLPGEKERKAREAWGFVKKHKLELAAAPLVWPVYVAKKANEELMTRVNKGVAAKLGERHVAAYGQTRREDLKKILGREPRESDYDAYVYLTTPGKGLGMTSKEVTASDIDVYNHLNRLVGAPITSRSQFETYKETYEKGMTVLDRKPPKERLEKKEWDAYSFLTTNAPTATAPTEEEFKGYLKDWGKARKAFHKAPLPAGVNNFEDYWKQSPYWAKWKEKLLA